MDLKDSRLVAEVLCDVEKERKRQNKLYGRQRYNNFGWLPILVEEVGEVAQAMQKGLMSEKESDADDLYKELVQVAAVACAIAEQVLEEQQSDNTR